MKLLEEIGAESDLIVVEEKLRRAHFQLAQAFNQNEKLLNALGEAREQIGALKDQVDKLCAPPSTYGVYLSTNQDATINILSQGRKLKVTGPKAEPESRPGTTCHPSSSVWVVYRWATSSKSSPPRRRIRRWMRRGAPACAITTCHRGMGSDSPKDASGITCTTGSGTKYIISSKVGKLLKVKFSLLTVSQQRRIRLLG